MSQENSHQIVYQNNFAYGQTMSTWAAPQNQQTYAFTYPQNDRSSFTDSTTYNAQFPVQYGSTADTDFYRSPGYYNTPNQWPQNYYTTTAAPGNQLFGNPSYSRTEQREQTRTSSYSAAAAQLPNLSRPPPAINKRENGDNTFHTSLSILDNPAAVSAAYTASWVNNTTNIPPDLKDEPDIYSGLTREDVGVNMFAATNFVDQFGQLTFGELPKEENKREERRPSREEPAKQLTWEERIRKAHVQKERAEQRGTNQPIEKIVKENNRNRTPKTNGVSGGSSVGNRGRDGKDHRQQRNCQNTMMWKNEAENRDHDAGNRNNRHQHNPVPILPGIMRGEVPPMMFPPGQHPMMIPRGMPFMGPPRHYMNNPQDERFKNTWLDASTTYPFAYPPMPYGPIPFPIDARGFRGGRGRGRGVSGGYRGGRHNNGDFSKQSMKETGEKTGESTPTPDDTASNEPTTASSPSVQAEPQTTA